MTTVKTLNTPGKHIAYLVPIAWDEMKKFLPMFIMVFFVAFNYNILKTTKDTIVLSAAGAEAIPFVKLYVMLPMAVLMTAFFTYLSQCYSFKKVFYIIITFFLVCICSFLMFIYPNREMFFLHTFAEKLALMLPAGMGGLVNIVRYWPLAMFYTLAELWTSMVLFILFWGFANQITKLEEAKRYYPLFSVASNISGLCAPQIFISATQNPNNEWEHGLFIVGLVVGISGMFSMLMFWWMNRYVLNDPKYYSKAESLTFSTPKKKMTFAEGLSYLAKSKYVRNIAIIVLIYNIVINLTEVIWKGQLASLYSDPRDLGIYLSNVMIYTSGLAIFFDVFVASNCIRKFGWTTTAILTPLVLLATSIGVFSFMLFDWPLTGAIAGVLGFSVLSISTSFGSVQNIVARASKYSLFDTAKEIAFIPLDTDTRIRAKAAIDGVGSRLGKGGGSIVLQVAFLFFGNIASSTFSIAIIIFGLIGVWLAVTIRLGTQFKEQTAMVNNKKGGPSASGGREDSVESRSVAGGISPTPASVKMKNIV